MLSYRPEELFDDNGTPRSWVEWLPRGELRMSANPHTNGGWLPRDLELPDFRDYAVKAGETAEATRVLGGWLRDVLAANAGWLTATEHGVSVVPHSAPIEVIATRQAMRAMVASIGYPYLVLRLGTIIPGDTGTPPAPAYPPSRSSTAPEPAPGRTLR